MACFPYLTGATEPTWGPAAANLTHVVARYKPRENRNVLKAYIKARKHKAGNEIVKSYATLETSWASAPPRFTSGRNRATYRPPNQTRNTLIIYSSYGDLGAGGGLA